MKSILAYLLVLISTNVEKKGIINTNFQLIDTEKNLITNKIFKNQKKKIIFFVSPHCKFSAKFFKYIVNLQNIELDKHYNIYLISPNNPNYITPDDLSYTDTGVKLEDMKIIKDRYGIKFPYIYDGEKQIITSFYEIKMTPSVIILDGQNKLLYRGKIGDINNKNQIETNQFEKLLDNEIKYNEPIITKIHGTEIKTKNNEKLTIRILKRYSEETVRLTKSDSEKISFFMKFNNKKISLFYIWRLYDKDYRTDLLKLSEIYKRYRKRGLSLTTICLASEKNKQKVLEHLKRAQLSSQNFISTFYDAKPIVEKIGYEDEFITPATICIAKDGKLLLKSRGIVKEATLKNEIIKYLD